MYLRKVNSIKKMLIMKRISIMFVNRQFTKNGRTNNFHFTPLGEQ